MSNVVMALAVVGMIGWFFFSALYLQRVLGYGSFATGIAYLPATVALGVISQGPPPALSSASAPSRRSAAVSA